MIVCPNCGAENADGTNHCGNCGARIDVGGAGAKTMIGFAAVTPEQIAQAQAETQSPAPAEPAKPKLPGLPKPGGLGGIPAPSSLGSSEPGKLNIPSPAGADPMDTAKTEVMQAVSSTPTVDEPAPSLAPPTKPESDVDAGWGDMSGGDDGWGGTPEPAAEPAEAAGGWGGTPEPAQSNSGWGDSSTPASSASPTDSGWGMPAGAPAGGEMAPSGPTSMGGGGGGGGGPMVPSGGRFVRGEVRDPVKTLVLVLFTCGIYGLIWTMGLINDLNGGLGEERFNFVKILLLSIVTCGLYGLYFQWQVCESVVEVQKKWGVEPNMDQPILFLTNFVYVGPFFIQTGLNNAWENGNPPA